MILPDGTYEVKCIECNVFHREDFSSKMLKLEVINHEKYNEKFVFFNFFYPDVEHSCYNVGRQITIRKLKKLNEYLGNIKEPEDVIGRIFYVDIGINETKIDEGFAYTNFVKDFSVRVH